MLRTLYVRYYIFRLLVQPRLAVSHGLPAPQPAAAHAVVFTECDVEQRNDKACRVLFVALTRARMRVEWVVSQRVEGMLAQRVEGA